MSRRLTSLAIVPPPSVASPFAEKRRRLDPQRASFVPHVTLKLPFRFGNGSTASDDLLEGIVAHECARHEPFQVRLEDVSVFDSCGAHGCVVHVRVALTPELRALHDGLARVLEGAGAQTTGLTAAREIALFYPHLTLAQGLSKEAADSALVAARHEHEPSTFLAERLVIGRSADGATWSTSQEVTLACAARIASMNPDVASTRSRERSRS